MEYMMYEQFKYALQNKKIGKFITRIKNNVNRKKNQRQRF